jgi:hypothetical protein
MFGRESKPCKVYEYGCLLPIAGEEVLIAEIRQRNDLWNKLVEVERETRLRAREALIIPGDPLPALYDQLKEVRTEIKDTRKKNRSGKIDVSFLQNQAKLIRENILALKSERLEKKKAITEQNRDVLDRIEMERRKAVKAISNASTLYWANKEEIINNYELARKRAMRVNTELKFHRFTGEGKVTVRFQKGLPIPEVFGTNTCLQIDPVPDEAWQHPTRAVRRKMSRTNIRLRVKSDEYRKPVWIELPMVMHRPIPLESEIRSASIVRERVGRSWRYKVVITATLGEGIKAHGKGAVGIDLGWRMVNDGMRVAYWADDQGGHGQLLLGLKVLHEFSKLNDLQGIRDKNFNAVRDKLSKWLPGKSIPDWLEEEISSLASWRAPGRLIALVNRWRENRFRGDDGIYKILEVWRKQEHHLYDWEANLRDQVKRRRREIYRVFAAGIALKYSMIVLENFDLRKVTRKKEAEEGTAGTLPMDKTGLLLLLVSCAWPLRMHVCIRVQTW